MPSVGEAVAVWWDALSLFALLAAVRLNNRCVPFVSPGNHGIRSDTAMFAVGTASGATWSASDRTVTSANRKP